VVVPVIPAVDKIPAVPLSVVVFNQLPQNQGRVHPVDIRDPLSAPGGEDVPFGHGHGPGPQSGMVLQSVGDIFGDILRFGAGTQDRGNT